MNVAISITQDELEKAAIWFNWSIELCGQIPRHLFVIPANNVPLGEVETLAKQAFAQVTLIVDGENLQSDWSAHRDLPRSARGPNSSFRQMAWHMYVNQLGPWFWCELDCIPLKPDWYLLLEKGYEEALAQGKVFLGAYCVDYKVPEHLSGNAVYPQDAVAVAPALVMPHSWQSGGKLYELGWDVAGGRETVPKSLFSPLVQHIFRHPGFKSKKDFSLVDPQAAVFHGCKDFSILPFLRKRGDAKCISEPTAPDVNVQPVLRSSGAGKVPTPPAPKTWLPGPAHWEENINVTREEIKPVERAVVFSTTTELNAKNYEVTAGYQPTLKERRQAHAAKMRAIKAQKRMEKQPPKDLKVPESWRPPVPPTPEPDPMDIIKARFTSPLAKARILKTLKAAPIIRGK